jgi:hypothetical protein
MTPNEHINFIAHGFANKYQKPLLTIDDLAEVLSITKATIIQYISRETFPIPLIRVGRNWFVSSLTLATYLVSQEGNAGAYR